MNFLFVVRHKKSGLHWLGESSKDPTYGLPEIKHWKWSSLLAESNKTELVSVKAFKTLGEMRTRKREFVRKHKINSSAVWVNSDLYKDVISPYVYLIRHKDSGQLYVGSRYAPNANPSEFFCTYFTSSGRVKELGYENFEILQVIACKNARDRERKFLKSFHKELGTEAFFARFLNRNTAPGILLDDKSIQKMKDSKMRNSRKGIPHSPEHCRAISEALKGHYVSKETAAKISAKAKGRSNGPRSEETKRKIGLGQLGRPPASEQTRLLISIARTGSKASTETKAKMSASQKARFAADPGLGKRLIKNALLARKTAR
jgi:hypothetical protein